MSITVEKRAVTWPQVIGWGALMIVQAFTAGVLWAKLGGRIDSLDERIATSSTASTERSRSLDDSIAQINNRLSPFDTAMFRLSVVETTVRANNINQNERIDRIVDSLGTKLDGVAETVNMLRGDVRVLTQRVDTSISGDKPKPTSLVKPVLP